MHGNNKYFFNWEDAIQAGTEAAGGKGCNLGRLASYGFPVPPGGVLGTQAYRVFIEENEFENTIGHLARDITAANVTSEETKQQLALFREKILNGKLSPAITAEIESALFNLKLEGQPVAVRSSASLEDSGAASFAGIHESYLNVTGNDNILLAIRKCYASLWTTRAVSYRRKLNIPDDALLPAVVIMAMVPAQAAGVGFTCDPRTGRRDVVMINANFGLGESVVDGRVEPDEYLLDARGFIPVLLDKRIGAKQGRTVTQAGGGTVFQSGQAPGENAKQVLPDAQIIKLALLLERVFESLGEGEVNQDIEWAFDGREFFLLQSRLVTSLPRYTYPQLREQPDYWSNANVKDALPMVQCTLNRRLVTGLFAAIITTPYKVSGYPALPGLSYSRFYHGRIYVNTSLVQWEFYDAFGIPPQETNKAAGGSQPEIHIVEEEKIKRKNSRARNRRKLKLGLAMLCARKKVDRAFAEVRAYARSWRQADLARLTDRELLAAAIDISAKTKAYAPIPGMTNSLLGLSFQMLTQALEKNFPGEGNAMANAIMLDRGNITSAEQGYRLLELAEIARQEPETRNYLTGKDYHPSTWETALPEKSIFKRTFRDFLDEFGHRAVYEGDLSNPRWREDPAYLLNLIRIFMKNMDYHKFKDTQKEKAAQYRQRIDQETPVLHRFKINWWLKQALRGAEMRETAKSELVRLAEPFRAVALETGRRLDPAVS